MENIRIESLWGLTTAQKLVWLYLYINGEGLYSTRQLALALELSTATVNTALKTLTEQGFLAQLQPPSGRRPARMRAVVAHQPDHV